MVDSIGQSFSFSWLQTIFLLFVWPWRRCFSTWCATSDRGKWTKRKPIRASRNRPGRNSSAPFSKRLDETRRKRRRRRNQSRRERTRRENERKKEVEFKKTNEATPSHTVDCSNARTLPRERLGGLWRLMFWPLFIRLFSPREINYSHRISFLFGFLFISYYFLFFFFFVYFFFLYFSHPAVAKTAGHFVPVAFNMSSTPHSPLPPKSPQKNGRTKTLILWN